MPTFYEFFAGGGMARAGLGRGWECLFANDVDSKKSAAYAVNWGSRGLKVEDVGRLTTKDLPGRADLAWASFPCQDLSLAGGQAGLDGARSGTFWPFWRLMESLAEEKRQPAIIAIENVRGALTSHEGKDFRAIVSAIANAGYRYGALVVDAVQFVPQSRPRLFIVGVRDDRNVPQALCGGGPTPGFHPAALVAAHRQLPQQAKRAWIWWSLPQPPPRETKLADLLEDDPAGLEWHTPAETKRLLSLMSTIHRAKVERAKRTNARIVGGVYKRTRLDADGRRAQRAEVRFDDVAGCLRTPAGGSSRQTIVVVNGRSVRSRLLSPREAARLMGLPDDYQLPANYNEAYHMAGDGVVVPVVRYLAANIFEPMLEAITGA